MKSFITPIFIALLGTGFARTAVADETLVESVDIPFASMNQEITYHPSKSEYERVRDETLARLRRGDLSARNNPGAGPWMRVETTAKIGMEYKDIGTGSGRKHLRQISAAEDALYRFEEARN